MHPFVLFGGKCLLLISAHQSLQALRYCAVCLVDSRVKRCSTQDQAWHPSVVYRVAVGYQTCSRHNHSSGQWKEWKGLCADGSRTLLVLEPASAAKQT